MLQNDRLKGNDLNRSSLFSFAIFSPFIGPNADGRTEALEALISQEVIMHVFRMTEQKKLDLVLNDTWTPYTKTWAPYFRFYYFLREAVSFC
jgi:hypothetical protein